MVLRRGQSGFTLLELVLVLVVIGIALSIAAPSLRGFRRGQRMRDCAEEVLALAQFARTQSVSSATPYRLNIDAATGTYWLTRFEGEQFVELGTDFGKQFTVPEGFVIALEKLADTDAAGIVFYPTARTQPARIRITDDQGDVTEVQCLTAAETFREVLPGDAR